MLHSSCVAGLLAVLVAPAEPDQVQSKPLARTAQEVLDRLSRPVIIDGFEPHTPFRDAAGFLSERLGITILIDTEAFKEELNISEPGAMPVKLPKVVEVPLREVLRLVCDQVQGAIAQQGTVIWVLPKARVLPRLLKQEVDVAFEKRPLHE